MKTIHILIGPKGSGKTFIGSLLERRLGVPFLRVEDIARRVKGDRSHDDAAYIYDVFSAIEGAVRQRLTVSDELAIESTGLTDAFDQMLVGLERDFQVNLIRITADPGRCLQRVRERDVAQHVDVSDNHVRRINQMVAQKQLSWCGEIANDDADEGSLVAGFCAATGRSRGQN
ncbi:MAG: AAA family ATPase [Myxococcales bacterium]|nr:AAA family ATPase [Myxococcales bacterium]